MKIFVTLATPNCLAGKLFVARSAQILNGDFLPTRLQNRVTFEANVYAPSNKGKSLPEFLLEESGGADAVAVLLDIPLAHNVSQLHPAIFLGQVDLTSYMPNVQNVLSGQAARLLRNLGFLLIDLEESTLFQAAILPLRNFDAEELRELALLCRDSTSEGEFGVRASTLIRQLVARRGPRLRSKYPYRYFKDDAGHNFRYGFEEHSRFETGGDHRVECDLNGQFRFGKRLEEQRHFNVTDGDGDDDHITAVFENCHGRRVDIVDRSHVNMFSNDFHK